MTTTGQARQLTGGLTHPQQSRLKSSCSSQAYVIMAEQGNEPQRHGQTASASTSEDTLYTHAWSWAAPPHEGIWEMPVPWPLGSWVRHRPTGVWGYVCRSECDMCYVYLPVHIAQVPERLRLAAIRMELVRTNGL